MSDTAADTVTVRRVEEELGAYYDASLPPALYADPHITSLAPSTASAAAGAVTVTVNGSRFEAGSVVEVNQVAQPTTFVDAAHLTISYDPAVAGPALFTVRNPNGEESNSVAFNVTALAALAEAEPATAEPELEAGAEGSAEPPPASGSGSSTTPAKRTRSKSP